MNKEPPKVETGLPNAVLCAKEDTNVVQQMHLRCFSIDSDTLTSTLDSNHIWCNILAFAPAVAVACRLSSL